MALSERRDNSGSKQSEAIDLDSFINATGIIAFLLDRDLTVRHVTPQAAALLNITPDDTGRRLDDSARHFGGIDLLEEAETSLSQHTVVERELLYKDRWYLLRLSPCLDSFDKTTGVALVFTDITGFKEEEGRSRLADLHAEYTLQTVRAPLLVLDRALKVTYANQAFFHTFKATPEASINQLIYNLGNGEWDIPDLRRLLTEVIPKDEQIRDYLVEHDFPSIGPRIMLLNARRIEQPSQKNSYLLLAIEDITEREHQRRALESIKAKLEASNRELEAFSYSVSHDLRAPLRSMSGFSKRLLELYDDKLDETGRNYLQRICNACERMSQLLTGLLTISRVGRVELRRTEVDLTSLARHIIEDLHTQNPDRKVAVEIADNIAAAGDPLLLENALRNLLDNAWKFTSKIDSACIEFGTFAREERTIYFIRDNGAGFDMQYAENLFGMFQRLHSRREYEGTGIGLAIIKRIIQRHGGEIWVEAEAQRGATFYFTLAPKRGVEND